MTRQNTQVDTYFIDAIRFSALVPYRANATNITKSKKILWYPIESKNIPRNTFIYGTREISRYSDAKYQAKFQFNTPRYQNNIQPYSYSSSLACITEILESYRALSTWARLEYYKQSVKLTCIETGVDFCNLELPSFSKLIHYTSSGRGSSSRYLRLFCADGMMYEYYKRAKRWSLPITEAEYTRRIKAGDMTAYVGSRNVEFKIYLKHSRIRVELAIRGRAAVSRFLNSPVSKNEPSRHVSKLADYGAIQHLSGSFLDRLQELFGGRLPRGAQEAVNRALDSFTSSPMPQAWEKTEKQEPILPLNLFVQKEEPAIDINADRQARAIDGVGIRLKPACTCINKVFLIFLPSRSVCLFLDNRGQARAPPMLFSRDFLFFAKFFLVQHLNTGRRCCCCLYYPSSLPPKTTNRQIFSIVMIFVVFLA